jgi:hypothetical protein
MEGKDIPKTEFHAQNFTPYPTQPHTHPPLARWSPNGSPPVMSSSRPLRRSRARNLHHPSPDPPPSLSLAPLASLSRFPVSQSAARGIVTDARLSVPIEFSFRSPPFPAAFAPSTATTDIPHSSRFLIARLHIPLPHRAHITDYRGLYKWPT